MQKYDFKTLSDKDLYQLMLDIQQERNCREHTRKKKLVNAFRETFNALHEAGYDIFIEGTCIANFDEFEIC